MLRPGNAGANNASDHVLVVDEAIAQLPPTIAVGHRPGDDPSLVKRKVVIRADSAGCTEKFVAAARSRNIGFSVVCRSNAQIHSAIFDTLGFEELWHQAIRQNGEEREGAAVIELTDLVTLPAWPTGTRLIVRREPLHPGVQHSLSPSLEYRYWGFYTDQKGDPVDLDRIMRAHAHVEQNISRLKDSGLLSFPFTKIDANRNWMATVMMAADLVRWVQLLCLDGYWRKPDQRPSAGASFTRRADWSTPHARELSPSSTAGRVQMPSSAPTRRWRRSAERSHFPRVRHQLDDAHPKAPRGSKTTATNRVNSEPAISDSPKWLHKTQQGSDQ